MARCAGSSAVSSMMTLPSGRRELDLTIAETSCWSAASARFS
jgi:hypothetical protein